VTGSSNQAVTWSIQEGAGGSITSGGVYTAPASAGVFHVIATASADATKSDTAEITVFPAGNVRVYQTGLPAGVVAPIQVTGPTGFAATTLTQRDQTISGVPIGVFNFTFPNVTSGGFTYQPIETATTIQRTLTLNGTIFFGVSFAPIVAGGTGTVSAAGSTVADHISPSAIVMPNGKALVVGGLSLTAEEFDPATSTYANAGTSPMPAGFETPSALMGNGKLLYAGGGYPTPTGQVAIYDPTPRTWSSGNPLAIARFHHTVTALANGRVLVAGGKNAAGQLLSSAELYDPTTGNWTTVGSMGVVRENHAAVRLANGKVLITGGASASGVVATAEMFDPATNQFAAVASAMSTARVYHHAVLLPNGKVVITGGGSTKIDVFTTGTDVFTAPADLKLARQYEGLTVLADGKVFISGGMNDGDAVASTEIFDPVANTVVFGPNMSLSRQEHVAVLLPNGKVLIVGGRGVNNNARRLSEYYVP
jgi:hypothetical protein